MLSESANLVVRTLLAPVCAGCGTPLDHPLSSPVCDACWAAVAAITPPLCEQCGDALPSWRPLAQRCVRCRRAPPHYTIARSAGRYEGPLPRLIHAFKYDARRFLAGPLAKLMRRAGRDVLSEADAVIPVPLHPWRAFRRGFNQSDDLCHQLGMPVWRVLRRSRLGPAQADLPAARRHANVRGAFALRRELRSGTLCARLRGTTVVLIDDVMTTGATVDDCARVLLDAGVRNVRVLTAARASAVSRV